MGILGSVDTVVWERLVGVLQIPENDCLGVTFFPVFGNVFRTFAYFVSFPYISSLDIYFLKLRDAVLQRGKFRY